MAALERLDAALDRICMGPKVPEGPKLIEIKCSTRPESVTPQSTVDIVSYNILSSATASGGYYRDTDGQPREFNENERRGMIYARIEGWMEEGKVICLQEVTYSFLFHEELRTLLETHRYDVYAHFYAFDVRARTTTLGLAAFVPIDRFAVADATLLRPWQYALESRNRQATLRDIETKIASLKELKIQLSRNRQIEEAKLIQAQLNDLQSDQKALEAESKKEVASYNDRTVLMLRLQSGSRVVSIGNIHVPCQFKDAKVATSIAFQAKQAVLAWAAQFDPAPLVFCGDFNSMPRQAGYSCFTGTQVYDEESIDPDRIQADTFSNVVTSEPWQDALAISDGCTCYALTEATVKAQAGAASFVPRPFHLDHFFVRDPDNLLKITRRLCPTLEQVRSRTSENPLPNLSINEPSDHLPIELTLDARS